MNRRSFLTGLCAVAPLLFLPKFESVKWKRTAQQLWVPNPKYATAPFEIRFLDEPAKYHPDIFKDVVVFKPHNWEVHGYLHERLHMESFFESNHLLRRYECVNGYFREVPAYIKSPTP
jgi:hypothetical protein